jgi:hypothetical protein
VAATPEAPAAEQPAAYTKSEQVLEDEFDLITASGWTPPGMSVEAFRQAYLDPTRRKALRNEKGAWKSYLNALRVMAVHRHTTGVRRRARCSPQ